jgi:outer membrane protein OmpA-like peptidoglycan-associated protein
MMPFGDYEAITTISSVSPQGIGMEISSQAPAAGDQGAGAAKPSTSKSFQATASGRLILSEDVAHAHEINLYFSNHDPKTFPGTTSGRLSKDVFNELKTKGESQFSYQLLTLKGAFTGLLDKLSKDNGNMNFQDLTKPMMTKVNCPLRRAASEDVAFPVILNDRRVELPVIHTVCKSDQDVLDLYVLDDEENPAVLSTGSKLGHFRGQVIRITYPEDKQVNQVERDLKESGRAKIYGIYFDFASATIRPQSAPVLREIAQAMKDNPTWRLSVEGHTDNIGGDASNLDLSKRRATAVMQTLASQYHIVADRFTSAGFGASRPVDTNDTIEGRARNRRVELARQ